MSNLSICNCSRCNKIIQQNARGLCPDCVDQESSNLIQMRRLIEKSRPNGGMPLEALSAVTGVSQDLILEYLQNGGLGTAGGYLIVPCAKCSTPVLGTQRQGKFCLECCKDVADEVGVQIQAKDVLDERDKAVKFIEENHERLFKKPSPKPKSDDKRFGLSGR